ncbi:MAG: PKD domain-containing protein [Bacteroidota bacterium]|nr:PKD domain-containing protein [Bacteroidota bacterium]
MLSLVLAFFYQINLSAFPGGTYTINPSAAVSATNYLSFTAFTNDLRNIARGDGGAAQYAVGGAGLQGHVICNVTPGTYNQRIQLTAIVGASASRTVTINGNGAVVAFTPTVNTDCGVIDLNGTDFFTFNNLEVQMNQTTYGYCYWIRNGADNNIIKNNKLRCNNITGVPAVGSAYIWLTNGTTGSASGNSGNNNLIDSNDMRSGTGLNHGPYYGINMYGITTPAASNAGNNNIVSNNLIRDFYLYGINHPYTYNTTIRNNTITNQGRTSLFTTKYGLYTITGTFTIENNRIFNLNGNTPQTSVIYPIYISMSSTALSLQNTNSKITNNWIYDFGTSTLQCYLYWYSAYLNQSISLDVDFNTIAFDYPTTVNNTSTIVRNVQGSWFRNFRNNILYNNIGGTGSKWLIYDQATTTTSTYRWTTYQNNCLFFGPNASGNLNYGWGVFDAAASSVGNLFSLQDMIAASFPASNISTNPNFLSINPANIDLTPTSIGMANKGATISGITSDNAGNTRNSTTPDIGAIEYFVDASLTAFNLSFPIPTCSGFTSPISGTLRNNSANTIRNPTVAYSINYGPKVEYTIPSNIAPNATVNFTFPNSVIFSKSGQTDVRLFLSTPDDQRTNDSLISSTIVSPAPGGSVVSHNTSLSSAFSVFNIDGKPDVTFRNENLIYDLSEPATLGYLNSDYGVKWRAFVSAKTLSGTNANVIATGNGSAPFRATINPTVAWEDSTIEVTIRVLSLESFCDTLYKRRVYIAPKANPDFIIPNPLCERTDNFFENTTTVKSGSVEYEWDFGDGSPLTDEASPIKNYANFGTYTVKLKATTKPYVFTTEKIINLNVTEMPIAQILNINKCQGEAVVLNNGTAYAGSGNTVYEWSFSDNSPSIITSSRTAVNKNFGPAGAYRVTLKATADGCTDVVSKTVYQFAKPTASYTVLSGECLNDEFKFSNQSSISQGTFGNAWFWNDMSNIASDMDPSYRFTSAGLKNVKLRVNSEFGCKDSMIMPINVKQIPTTNFTYPFACDRTPTPFTNTTNLNGELLDKYTWNLGQGSPINQTAPLVTWSNLGPRTVTLKTDLQNGCSSEISKVINVGVQPTVDFEFDSQCAGSALTFTNLTTFPKGDIQYKWNFGDGSISNIAAPMHTYSNGQTFNVKLIANIINGCADSITKIVNVGELPATCDFNIERNWSVNSKNFNFTPIGGSTNGIQYIWLTGEGNRLTSNGTGTNYTYNGSLQYCVTMIASTPDGCDCSKTKCIDLSTSIDEINSNHVSIYPNPSNGLFNIKMKESTNLMNVIVYNVLGEVVFQFGYNNQEVVMDLNHLNNGVYIVKITGNNQTHTQKINIIK